MKCYAVLVASVLVFGSALAAEPQQERVVLPKTAIPTHYDLAIVPNAAAKTFTGKVAITVKVVSATHDIVLNADELAFKAVTLSGHKEKPAVQFDHEKQTATLHFGKDIAPGEYTLVIAYDGKINDSPAGLFALDYAAKDGKKRALFTQFENSDARRFLPSWDEPGIKATFTLTTTLPQGEMPISNMPIASQKALKGGLKEVAFQQSPKMSSYLLFYGQGDFERISRKVGNVDVGVIFKRGDAAKAGYALDSAAEILPFYNAYFGTPFPLPKLDMIAGPGQSQFFGAMENWGAIFYFERDLLFDPKTSDEGDRRGAFITIAHEMAHQWFGDLVTMAWWDDLWLNEGFASWMEYKAADKLHPDWHIWLEGTRDKQRAMSSDARSGTHPIIQPITDVLQASQAFDEITYSKGAAVIRMLENYLGEEKFRDGVRAYMAKYAYGNTVTDDLWAELEKSSGQPVTAIAHDFTLQPGVPLISVAQSKAGITLSQSRFAVDEGGKAKLTWQVPVTVTGRDGAVIWRGVVGAAPVDIALPKDGVAIVNAGQAGYFRTLYDPAQFAKLAEYFAALSADDQLGVLADSNALGRNGNAPVTDLLVLLGKASPSMDANVQQEIASQVSGLTHLFTDLPGEAKAKAYGAAVLHPLFAAVGWDAKPSDGPNTALLRSALIEALGTDADDAAVITEARARFARFVQDPASLPAEIRSSVLAVVAANADAADWEKLHQLAATTSNSMEKQEFYRLLGLSKNKAVAQKALDLSLSEEVPTTLRPAIVSTVPSHHPVLAFDFAVAHQKAFDALLEPSSRNQFYMRLAAAASDPAMLPKIDSFVEANIPPTARAIVVKVKANIALTIKRRAEAAPKIDTWLTARCKEAAGGMVCAK